MRWLPYGLNTKHKWLRRNPRYDSLFVVLTQVDWHYQALQQNTSHEIVVMELRKELEKAKENISSIIRENDAILVESEKKVRVL